eukprot:6568596-Prymnesium_polylepis.1
MHLRAPTCARRPRASRDRAGHEPAKPIPPPFDGARFGFSKRSVVLREARVARQNDGGPCGGWKNWFGGDAQTVSQYEFPATI